MIDHAVPDVPTKLLIGGAERDASGGGSFQVADPATGTVLYDVADAAPGDGLLALDSATAAGPAWARVPPRRRAEILRRVHDLLIERTEEFALLITLEMGKSLTESRAEVAYAAQFFRWFAEEAVRIDGQWKVSEDGSARVLVMRQPVGPCLLITPWNVPLAMPARKIAPALAAGCTVIVKPAEQAPLSTLKLAAVLAEAGTPDGVVNVIPTSRPAAVTGPLIRDGRLRKLSFTGSTEVGRILLAAASNTVLRTSLELGGNAPFLVCHDADVDAAVRGAVIAKTRNIGEACVAANRFYVHTGVADEFVTKLTERMRALRVGPGIAQGTDLGPLIDGRQRERVAGLVDDAVRHGAQVRTGGVVPDGPGFFYPPTVLTGVVPGSAITREEIFGPVATIQTFTDETEAVREANDTVHGLVSYLYTRDLTRAVLLSEQLESGMVGLNRGLVSDASAPFGGVKQSGLGREGGNSGINEYLEEKYIAIDIPT